MSVDVLTWAPDRPRFCAPPEGSEAGERAFNLWRGFRPLTPPANWQEWAALFDRHVEFLVPIEAERARFLQWLGHAVQHPGTLPHTAYLMVTEKTGVGRNWLASVLARVLRGYVAAGVSIADVLDGKFNGRLSRKLLAIVDETREGMSERRYQRGEALKRLVTEEFRHINPKYGVQSVEYNSCRWLMFSNHFDALPFDNNDRRIVVIENPGERAAPDYYSYIYGLVDNPAFIASVRRRLETINFAGFNPGEHAPMSAAKAKALNSMTSDADQACRAFAEAWPGDLAGNRHIRQYITAVFGEDAEPRGKGLAHAASRAGMIPTSRVVKIFGQNDRITIVRNLSPEAVEKMDPAIIAKIVNDASARFTLDAGNARNASNGVL